jgi:hypothetical protein
MEAEDMRPEYAFSRGGPNKYADIYAEYVRRLRSATKLPATDRTHQIGFKEQAKRVLSAYYDARLQPGHIPPIHRRFNLVSPDRNIVGTAHYYSKSSPATLATISEADWLLEKTGCSSTFLVFGNNISVPLLWLNSYGNLLSDVVIYFLYEDNHLEYLAGSHVK